MERYLLDFAAIECQIKGFSSAFPVGYPDSSTPDEVRRAQGSKHCDSNDKDEDNNPNVNNHKYIVNNGIKEMKLQIMLLQKQIAKNVTIEMHYK